VKSLPRVECPDCGGAGYFRRDVEPGHSQFGKLIRCENVFHSEDRQARLVRLSGLSPQEMGRRLADIRRIDIPSSSNVEMLDAAQGVIDNPFGMLFIFGGPGNAKSEVLISIVNELNEANKGPAIYNKFVSLVEYLKGGFSCRAKSDFNTRFEQLLSAPVLCLDELDKGRSTDWQEELLFQLLDERYRQASHGLSLTVLASNTDPEELPESIYDRLRQFVIVENTAPSARPSMGVRK